MESDDIKHCREKLRKDARAIFEAGLMAVKPDVALRKHISLASGTLKIAAHDVPVRDRRVFVLAFGKAAAAMAQTLEQILGEHLTAGIAVTKYGHAENFRSDKITLYEAGHPLPDENGVKAAQKVIELAHQAGEDDLVLVAISGGGSALLSMPAAGLSLADKQHTTDLLLKSGADIRELNTVRKHLSTVKGGQLAAAIAPAQHYSLILSDVIGDPLDFIASGPTVPDSTTFQDARTICEKYGLSDRLSQAVRDYLQKGVHGNIAETPKQGDAIFENGACVLIANNLQAAQAAFDKAKELRYNSMILTTNLQGEARELAKLFPALARDLLERQDPVALPACIICGGETTVTVKGKGKGGRNQELALATLPGLAGLACCTLLSGGTDGTDGPTDAAGALVDDQSAAQAKQAGIDWQDYLAQNDAYHFFAQAGGLLITGPTETNVMDLQILLAAQC